MDNEFDITESALSNPAPTESIEVAPSQQPSAVEVPVVPVDNTEKVESFNRIKAERRQKMAESNKKTDELDVSPQEKQKRKIYDKTNHYVDWITDLTSGDINGSTSLDVLEKVITDKVLAPGGEYNWLLSENLLTPQEVTALMSELSKAKEAFIHHVTASMPEAEAESVRANLKDKVSVKAAIAWMVQGEFDDNEYPNRERGTGVIKTEPKMDQLQALFKELDGVAENLVDVSNVDSFVAMFFDTGNAYFEGWRGGAERADKDPAFEVLLQIFSDKNLMEAFQEVLFKELDVDAHHHSSMEEYWKETFENLETADPQSREFTTFEEAFKKAFTELADRGFGHAPEINLAKLLRPDQKSFREQILLRRKNAYRL